MSLATPKYQLPYPEGRDTPDMPGSIHALALAVEGAFAGWASGTLALRPAAGKAGRIYTQTDGIQPRWVDDGAAYRSLGARIAAIAATDVAQIVQGVAGQSGDFVQYQNSAGTVMARVDSNGNLIAAGATLGGSAALTTASSIPESKITGLTTDLGNRALDTAVLHKTGGETIQAVSNVVAQVVKAFSAQTNDLVQYQSAAAAILAAVTAGGSFKSAAVNNVFGSYTDAPGAALNGVAVAGTVPLIAKGDTGTDLQRWLATSGAVQSRITGDGGYAGPRSVITGVTDQIQLLVQGVSSQALSPLTQYKLGLSASVDFAQWLNSVGTVLAKVDSAGAYDGSDVRVATKSLPRGILDANTVVTTVDITSGAFTPALSSRAVDLKAGRRYRTTCTIPFINADGGDSVIIIRVDPPAGMTPLTSRYMYWANKYSPADAPSGAEQGLADSGVTLITEWVQPAADLSGVVFTLGAYKSSGANAHLHSSAISVIAIVVEDMGT